MLIPVATVVLILLSTLTALHADVTTVQRTIVKTMGHGAWDDIQDQTSGGAQGKSARLSYGGEGFATRNGDFGTIVDVKESRVYRLNYRDQQYSVVSFEDERNAVSKRRTALENLVRDMSQPSTATTFGSDPLGDRPFRAASRKVAFEVSVETNELLDQRTIAGRTARAVKIVVKGQEKNRPVDISSGWILTSTVWLTSSDPELDGLAAIRERYCQAIMGQTCLGFAADVALDLSVEPAFPEAAAAMSRALAARTGTMLSSTTTFELIKGADEMKQDARSREDAAKNGVRVLGGPPSRRSVAITISQEYTSIVSDVARGDLTVPNGFRLRKD